MINAPGGASIIYGTMGFNYIVQFLLTESIEKVDNYD
jgi:hypothetical protein